MQPATDRRDGASRPEALWRHPAPEQTQMWQFLQRVRARHQPGLRDYDDLYRWSTRDTAAFWAEVWAFVGIVSSAPYARVLARADAPLFPRPAFFAGARLNFAQNLLFPELVVAEAPAEERAAVEERAAAAEETALVGVAEHGQRQVVTWAELRERVGRCQAGLRALGVGRGDRVAGYVGNNVQAVVGMLATTALAAVWTAVSPDTGPFAVLQRLRQVRPALLFADNATFYNGRVHPARDKIAAVVAGLPGLAAVVVVDAVPLPHAVAPPPVPAAASAHVYSYADFLTLGRALQPARALHFEQTPADHPVYILYSSGTTGPPKCIVHGAVGTLIQHKKELLLHCSLTPRSRLLYYTTCSWMMWNWAVSALACGATVILYDGSPFRYSPPSPSAAAAGSLESAADELAMPRLLAELAVSHFGTSAKYLSLLEQRRVRIPPSFRLDRLEAIYSTASPLAPSTFRYVYAIFPPAVALASISGGTDIVSLFGAPCPLTPLYAGEIQQRGLGMAVAVFDPLTGDDVTEQGVAGELVCTRPFPSQPLGFWPVKTDGVRGGSSDLEVVITEENGSESALFLGLDEGALQEREQESAKDRPATDNAVDDRPVTNRAATDIAATDNAVHDRPCGNQVAGPEQAARALYQHAYFARFAGVWHQGDYVRLNPDTRGMVMLGRSDGVLKPAGVRFGSGEIYSVLAARFGREVDDAVCVGRRRRRAGLHGLQPGGMQSGQSRLGRSDGVQSAEGVQSAQSAQSAQSRESEDSRESLQSVESSESRLGQSDGVQSARQSGVQSGQSGVQSPAQPSVQAGQPVDQTEAEDEDEEVILFIKTRDTTGSDSDTDKDNSTNLGQRIKSAVRECLTARHVPTLIVRCPDIPVTLNGKKMEQLVKRIISDPASTEPAGQGVIANPECLAWYRAWPLEQ